MDQMNQEVVYHIMIKDGNLLQTAEIKRLVGNVCTHVIVNIAQNVTQ